MYILPFFIHLFTDEHLICFYLITIISNAATNLGEQISVWVPVFNYFSYIFTKGIDFLKFLILVYLLQVYNYCISSFFQDIGVNIFIKTSHLMKVNKLYCPWNIIYLNILKYWLYMIFQLAIFHSMYLLHIKYYIGYCTGNKMVLFTQTLEKW